MRDYDGMTGFAQVFRALLTRTSGRSEPTTPPYQSFSWLFLGHGPEQLMINSQKMPLPFNHFQHPEAIESMSPDIFNMLTDTSGRRRISPAVQLPSPLTNAPF
jgi:hypothetical protein